MQQPSCLWRPISVNVNVNDGNVLWFQCPSRSPTPRPSGSGSGPEMTASALAMQAGIFCLQSLLNTWRNWLLYLEFEEYFWGRGEFLQLNRTTNQDAVSGFISGDIGRAGPFTQRMVVPDMYKGSCLTVTSIGSRNITSLDSYSKLLLPFLPPSALFQLLPALTLGQHYLCHFDALKKNVQEWACPRKTSLRN